MKPETAGYLIIAMILYTFNLLPIILDGGNFGHVIGAIIMGIALLMVVVARLVFGEWP